MQRPNQKKHQCKLLIETDISKYMFSINYRPLWRSNILTVQAKHITLYGIEKSGVGKFTKSASVYNCNRMSEVSSIISTIFIEEFSESARNAYLSNTFGSFSELKKFWT